MSGTPCDLAVRGGRYLTNGPPLPEGSSLLVSGGLISAFLPPGKALPPARRVLDATGRVVIPGLVNAHTHAAMSLFRGLVDGLPLAQWLERLWRAEAAAVTPEMVYWCTLLSCAEMLLSGTTCFADSYFFEEEVARAAEAAGMRAVCGQGLLDLATPDAAAGQGPARLKRFLDGFPASALVRPAVFCHTVYTCAPATLRAAWELAREHRCLFALHLAETAAEVRECVRQHGVSPLRLLESLGLLDEGCAVVHGVHLDEAEIALLAERGVGVVHCPESNLKLASGIAPAGRMLQAGVRLALGTDGPASNDDLDLLGEAATAGRLERLTGRNQRWPDGATLLRLATAGGAEVLGLPCGVLAPGRPADLAVIEPRRPHLQPEVPTEERLAEQVIFCARGADVRTVVVGGEVVVEEGRLTRIDVEEVKGRVREMAGRLC